MMNYSWINSIMFSSPVVKSSDPLPEVHSSSFVAVDVPSSTSEIELPTTSQFPTRSNDQFDRTLSSSSSFRVSFAMDEMDFVMVETRVPLLTPSSSFPTPPLNHMNASRSFTSSSSFSSTRSSPPPSQLSNLDTIPSPSSSLLPNPYIVRTSPPSSSSALPQDYNSSSSRNTVSLSTSLSSASSNQHSDDSTSLSDFPVSASTRPPKTIVITRTSFKWQEIVLAISFTVPVGLLSTTFKAVDGTLVPDVLFTSNPALFYIFIILDAVAFTASVIGILIHALKKNKYLYCLSLLAFTALVFAFAIYLWVLLPNFLRFVPYVLLIAILLVLLYVSVSLYKQAVSSKLQLQPLVAATSS